MRIVRVEESEPTSHLARDGSPSAPPRDGRYSVFRDRMRARPGANTSWVPGALGLAVGWLGLDWPALDSPLGRLA